MTTIPKIGEELNISGFKAISLTADNTANIQAFATANNISVSQAEAILKTNQSYSNFYKSFVSADEDDNSVILGTDTTIEKDGFSFQVSAQKENYKPKVSVSKGICTIDAKDCTIVLEDIPADTKELVIKGSNIKFSTPIQVPLITNNAKNSTIIGSDYDDNIVNKGSGTTIKTGYGDDTVTNNASDSTIDTGDGDDTVINNGSKSTINTGDGDDTIENSSKGTNVSISGGSGTNNITNNAKNTIISSQSTNTTGEILSFNGFELEVSDITQGVPVLTFGSNTLTITANGCTLSLNKAPSNNNKIVIKGSDVNFTSNVQTASITNNAPNSTITGSNFDDTIINNDKAEGTTINAGKGNDTITNKANNTVLNGEDGHDKITNSVANKKNVINTVVINAGKGNDTIINNSNGENIFINGQTGTNTITNKGSNVTINGGDSVDNITNSGKQVTINGNAGADEITNTGEGATISGGAGNDTINNKGKNSIISGNSGKNSITNNQKTATINEDEVEEEIDNTSTVEQLNEISKIMASSTNYTNKTIAENGFSFQVLSTTKNYTPSYTLQNGVLTIEAKNCSINLTALPANTKVVLNGKNVNFSSSVKLDITNYATDSKITGSSSDDTIINRGANTQILGGNGADTISNYSEGVTISAGKGDDNVINYAKNVSIKGDDGNDTIENASLAATGVTIDGGKGTNKTTSKASDTKITNAGKAASNPNAQKVTCNGFEFELLEGTAPTMKCSGGNITITANNCTIVLTKVPDKYADGKATITLNGSGINFTSNVQTKQITNNATDTKITGSDYADKIINNKKAENVTINAGYGNDTIINNANNVVVNGGDGNDTITNQNNGKYVTINGGFGNDTITNKVSSANIVINGTAGNNKITNSGKYVTINGGKDTDTIINTGAEAKINAGAGDDDITNSGTGAQIAGGDGDDTITNKAKKVTIKGNAGDDHITNTGNESVVDGGTGTNTMSIKGSNSTLVKNDNDVISDNGKNTVQVYSNENNQIEISSLSISLEEVSTENIDIHIAEVETLLATLDSTISDYDTKIATLEGQLLILKQCKSKYTELNAELANTTLTDSDKEALAQIINNDIANQQKLTALQLSYLQGDISEEEFQAQYKVYVDASIDSEIKKKELTTNSTITEDVRNDIEAKQEALYRAMFLRIQNLMLKIQKAQLESDIATAQSNQDTETEAALKEEQAEKEAQITQNESDTKVQEELAQGMDSTITVLLKDVVIYSQDTEEDKIELKSLIQQKQDLLIQITELKTQLDAAVKSGDAELVARLEESIKFLGIDVEALNSQITSLTNKLTASFVQASEVAQIVNSLKGLFTIGSDGTLSLVEAENGYYAAIDFNNDGFNTAAELAILDELKKLSEDTIKNLINGTYLQIRKGEKDILKAIEAKILEAKGLAEVPNVDTTTEIDTTYEAFLAAVDTDNDGKLTKEEIIYAFNNQTNANVRGILGYLTDGTNMTDIFNMLAELDSDTDINDAINFNDENIKKLLSADGQITDKNMKLLVLGGYYYKNTSESEPAFNTIKTFIENVNSGSQVVNNKIIVELERVTAAIQQGELTKTEIDSIITNMLTASNSNTVKNLLGFFGLDTESKFDETPVYDGNGNITSFKINGLEYKVSYHDNGMIASMSSPKQDGNKITTTATDYYANGVTKQVTITVVNANGEKTVSKKIFDEKGLLIEIAEATYTDDNNYVETSKKYISRAFEPKDIYLSSKTTKTVIDGKATDNTEKYETLDEKLEKQEKALKQVMLKAFKETSTGVNTLTLSVFNNIFDEYLSNYISGKTPGTLYTNIMQALYNNGLNTTYLLRCTSENNGDGLAIKRASEAIETSYKNNEYTIADQNAGLKTDIITDATGYQFKISYKANSQADLQYDYFVDANGNLVINATDCIVDMLGLGDNAGNVIISGENVTFNSNSVTLKSITNSAKNATINGSFGDDNIKNTAEAVNSTINSNGGYDLISNDAEYAAIKVSGNGSAIYNAGENTSIDTETSNNYIADFAKTTYILNSDKYDLTVKSTKKTPSVVDDATTPEIEGYKETEYTNTKSFSQYGVVYHISTNDNNFSNIEVTFDENQGILNITGSNCKIEMISNNGNVKQLNLNGSQINFNTAVAFSRGIMNNANSSVINGSSEKDIIINYGEATVINGLGGADNIENNAKYATINGGDGDDTITNNGNFSTISGDEGANNITNIANNVTINNSANDTVNDTGSDTKKNEATAPSAETESAAKEEINTLIASESFKKLAITSEEVDDIITRKGSYTEALKYLKQIDYMQLYFDAVTITAIATSETDEFNNEIMEDIQIEIEAEATSNPQAYIKSQMIKDGSSMTLAEILSSTTTGDVTEKDGKLYANDGSKLVELGIDADTYLELFPNVKRYMVEQGNQNDCFFIATTMIDFMENDLGRTRLLQMFSEDASGNITITFPGLTSYPVTFSGGKLKSTSTEGVDACYGLQLLEQAYAIAKYAESKGVSTSSVNISDALSFYADGGYATEVYNDLSTTGTSTYKSDGKIITETNGEDLLAAVASRLASSSQNVATTLVSNYTAGGSVRTIDSATASKYHLITGHQYSIEKIDNNYVYIKNPWYAYCVTKIPYETFIKTFYGFAEATIV